MSDQSRLERFERRTEWPLAAVAIAFLGIYSVQVLTQPHGPTAHALNVGLWVLYAIFVVDYFARLYLAAPRLRWFFHNILDLALVLLPFLRPLRLLSLAIVIESLQRAVGHTVRGRIIAYTLCGSVAIIYSASLAMLQAERNMPGSKVTNFGDALWWAITTVTTVGYGDITPVTATGRMVAVALMIAGISLLGVVTATLASWIVTAVQAEDEANRAATHAEIEDLRVEIRRLAKSLTDNAGPAYGEGLDGGRMKESG